MKIHIQKLKAIILYFTENTKPIYLGKVKLMKLIYFLDFMHIKKYGAPLTFDRYVRLEHGPVPSTILNLVNNAADDFDNAELADTITFEKPEGTNMCRILPLRKLAPEDFDLFSKNELETLKRVCQRFGNETTRYIENASHSEAPWLKTQPFGDISYLLASEDPDCMVAKEDIELILNLV